jgi:glycosyltransferase involved in cell wall biosynthesis
MAAAGERKELITALVCTRNRGAKIAATVRSILANAHPRFELVVVDQSDDEETVVALRPFAADPRFVYVPSDTVGKGKALNIGLNRARGSVVALTDDDCRVPADWLSGIAALMRRYPQAALLFTNVQAPEYDREAGFIPTCDFSQERLVTSLRERPWGIGAGMALRRDTIRAIGGVDEMLGPGGPFFSGEDIDLLLRTILKGYGVIETNQIAVIHDGFRDWGQGRALMERDWFSLGAVYSKFLRRRPRRSWRYVLYQIVMKLLWPPVVKLQRDGRLQGWVPIKSFVDGLQHGWQTPLDPRMMLFTPGKNGHGS